MSEELHTGYDVKLRGRISRYRVVHLGPYDSRKYGMEADELRVQRHAPTRPGRTVGRQLTVRRGEIEAVCHGISDKGWPVWSRITGWLPSFPKMPGRWFYNFDQRAFVTSGDTVFGRRADDPALVEAAKQMTDAVA